MKPNDKTPPGTEPLRPSDSESHFPARSRGSDHIFRTLTEKSFVGMYVAQNGLFVRVNPIIASVSGYAVEELEGRRADSQ